jgi:hypothetical protein
MEIKSFILIAHVLAVTFGVGGAFMLDIYLLRHLRGAVIEEKDAAFARYVATFVKIGLVGLWASGIGLLAIAPDGPASVISNPKVQAKLVVVVILTLNALFIETVALPLVKRNVGRHLFDGENELGRTLILGSGAVSSVSWAVPMALGLARELNHVVPAATILGFYSGLLAIACAGGQVIGRYVYRLDTERCPQPVEQSPRFHAVAQQALETAFAPASRAAVSTNAFLHAPGARERSGWEISPTPTRRQVGAR